jgi:hypothetical protein
VDRVVAAKKYAGQLDILIGTMIEIPRAALTADEVAEHADFFSFGTNDLTQMTFGYSRDDVNSFLPDYLKQEILPNDPFQSLDTSGCGPVGGDGRRQRAIREKGSESRHLWRTWWRSGLDRLLPQGRLELCELLAVPRADCSAGRRSGHSDGRVSQRLIRSSAVVFLWGDHGRLLSTSNR